MFRDQKRNKRANEDTSALFHSAPHVYAPDEDELQVNQGKIETLINKRYDDEDNGFLRITEMNYFEQYDNYKDNYPLFKLRMKLWKAYM
jgi:hypothetical protein